MRYESRCRVEARSAPGVTFTIARMSFGRRLELMRRVRELARRIEFHEAGAGTHDKIEAAVLAAETDRLYMDWGLADIEGLELDGRPATRESLASDGPEELTREVIDAIKHECGLSSDEEKN